MSDEINKETIDAVDQEISQQEEKQRAQKFEDTQKQFEEFQKKMEQQLEETKKQHEAQLKERDDKIESIKSDFEKQMDNISLRKSVSVNDVKEPKEAAKKPYSELSVEEQNQADEAWFRSQGFI